MVSPPTGEGGTEYQRGRALWARKVQKERLTPALRARVLKVLRFDGASGARVVVAALPQFLSLLPQEGGVVGGRRTGASVLL